MKNDSNARAGQNAINLFHHVAETSKAYRDFLKRHALSPKTVTKPSDFIRVPTTDKHNYIKKYSIQDRLYDGKTLSDFYMICSSSGTSGEPTFWPRDITIDTMLEGKKEELYEEHFQISKKKTLCVITFGLGVWTAGMLTSKLSWAAARKNKFTVVTPGIQKETAADLMKYLSPFYDQTIIVGYPPFLTDLVDYAQKQRINLKKTNTKLFYTSERVSEKWRNLMAKRVSRRSSRHDIVGFYACSDTGIIGAETRFIIDLLDKATKNPKFSTALFGSADTPTLMQYSPLAKYLECVDGEIIITAKQPMPLIRYNIHDRGGLLTGSQIKTICKSYGVPFDHHYADSHFLYIFGRSDAVKITANIYIEDIRYCLEHSQWKHKLSGNFQYGTEATKNARYRLKVIVYLKHGMTIAQVEQEKFAKEFYENLLKANNDFKMIQSGTTIEPFAFEFKPDQQNKYKTSKLKYFL